MFRSSAIDADAATDAAVERPLNRRPHIVRERVVIDAFGGNSVNKQLVLLHDGGAVDNGAVLPSKVIAILDDDKLALVVVQETDAIQAVRFV